MNEQATPALVLKMPKYLFHLTINCSVLMFIRMSTFPVYKNKNVTIRKKKCKFLLGYLKYW